MSIKKHKLKSRICSWIVFLFGIISIFYYSLYSHEDTQQYYAPVEQNPSSVFFLEPKLQNNNSIQSGSKSSVFQSEIKSDENVTNKVNNNMDVENYNNIILKLEQEYITANETINQRFLTPKFDMKRRYWKTWWQPAECSRLVVRFVVPKSLDKCALSSFPGSGNSWFRSLLEAASGVFTGSEYQDNQLFMWGYLGEKEDFTAGTTIIQKSHNHNIKFIENFNGTGIVLIRNPYRAILAYHNFLFGSHKFYAPIVNYRRKDWPTFVRIQLKIWLEVVVHWMKVGTRVLIIHYEQLRRHPLQEITKALNFLKIPKDQQRFHCLQKNFGSNVKRQDEHFPTNLTIFPNHIRNVTDRAIRYASYLLVKNGHEALPLHFYEFYNGTSSSKIKFVPCDKDETIVECDHRIDNLNLEFSVNARREQFYKEKEIKKKPDYFSLKEAIQNKVESSAFQFISKVMKGVTKNPVQQILKNAALVEAKFGNSNRNDPIVNKIFYNKNSVNI